MGRVEVAPPAAAPLVRPDEVKAIRYRLNQSQSEFATMIGVTLATLQGWEEGKHRPDGPAMALLRVAAKNPRIVARTLGRSRASTRSVAPHRRQREYPKRDVPEE